jgi:hypothetical protein
MRYWELLRGRKLRVPRRKDRVVDIEGAWGTLTNTKTAGATEDQGPLLYRLLAPFSLV